MEDVRAIKQNTSWLYEYKLKDHLGNVRTTFIDENNNGLISSSEIKQRNDYYAFGMEQKSSTLGSFGLNANRYKYNGKELFEEMNLDLQNYGARYYDPSVGRWTSVDPIANKFAHVTTYNYAENSPIANIDLWGLQKVFFAKVLQNNQTFKTAYNINKQTYGGKAFEKLGYILLND